jgi:hypothetical protein
VISFPFVLTFCVRFRCILSWLGQTKDCFTAQHAVSMRMSIWLRIRIMCSIVAACLLAECFQWANTIKLHYICLHIVERIEMQIAPAIWYSCENSSFGVKQHSLAQYAWNKVNVKKNQTGPCLWFCFFYVQATYDAPNMGLAMVHAQLSPIITYGEGILYLPLDVTWWVPLCVEPCWEP